MVSEDSSLYLINLRMYPNSPSCPRNGSLHVPLSLRRTTQLQHRMEEEEFHDHLLTYLMWTRCLKSPEPGYERRSWQRIVADTRVWRVSTGLLNQ